MKSLLPPCSPFLILMSPLPARAYFRRTLPYIRAASIFTSDLCRAATPACKDLFAGRIGDQYLVFLFTAGIFLIQSFLLITIRSRFFTDAPPWTLVPVILAAGLMNPMGWVLSTPSVYNAAIAARQFLFLAGLFATFSAFAVGGVSAPKLALAGFLWAVALGSRITLILPIAFMVLISLIGVAFDFRPPAAFLWLRPASALLITLAIGLGSLCWYNWARFGSPFETGIKYQLAGVPLQAYGGQISSPSFTAQNLYNYFLTHPD